MQETELSWKSVKRWSKIPQATQDHHKPHYLLLQVEDKLLWPSFSNKHRAAWTLKTQAELYKTKIPYITAHAILSLRVKVRTVSSLAEGLGQEVHLMVRAGITRPSGQKQLRR